MTVRSMARTVVITVVLIAMAGGAVAGLIQPLQP